MKHVLRLVALCVAAVTALTFVHFITLGARGELTPLVRSGAPGALSVANWILVILAGPVAAVGLFNLTRVGRRAAILLCLAALSYHAIGLTFWKTPETPLGPILEALAWNGGLLALLMSPAARRIA